MILSLFMSKIQRKKMISISSKQNKETKQKNKTKQKMRQKKTKTKTQKTQKREKREREKIKPLELITLLKNLTLTIRASGVSSQTQEKAHRSTFDRKEHKFVPRSSGNLLILMKRMK